MIEKHPERRFKAAFEAYLEREMPNAREEVSLTLAHSASTDIQHPGLRQNQYRDKLFKQFEKAPENRMSLS